MTESNLVRKTMRLRIWFIGILAVLAVASLMMLGRGIIRIDSSVVCYNMINQQTQSALYSGPSGIVV